jgi:hypothetical protein
MAEVKLPLSAAEEREIAALATRLAVVVGGSDIAVAMCAVVFLIGNILANATDDQERRRLLSILALNLQPIAELQKRRKRPPRAQTS